MDSLYCPQCRRQVHQDDLFCASCGADQRAPAYRSARLPVQPQSADSSTPRQVTEELVDKELADLKRQLEAEVNHRPKLRLLGHKLITTTEGRQFIIGLVHNDAYEDCLEAEITSNVSDEMGNHIGSFIQRTSNIPEQKNWSFAMPVNPPLAASYRITGLRGDFQTYRDEAEYQMSWREAEKQAEWEMAEWDARRDYEGILRREARSREVAYDLESREQVCWSVWISFPF